MSKSDLLSGDKVVPSSSDSTLSIPVVRVDPQGPMWVAGRVVETGKSETLIPI